MGGRLLDWIGSGAAADIPTAADAVSRTATGGTALYFAVDTKHLFILDTSGPAWYDMDLPSLAAMTFEGIQDMVSTFLVQGTGIILTYDDVANTLTIACSVTQYTDEMAQDALNALIASGTHNGITITYDDVANTLSFSVDAQAISGLTDVDLSTPPTDGQALVWHAASSKWIPGTVAASIDALTDVDTSTTPPTDGQVLVWSAADGKWIPGTVSGGGGGSGDLVKIATQTLAVAGTTINFNAIPQLYDDLILVIYFAMNANTANERIMMTFNGDSGAHYDWRRASALDGEQALNQTSGMLASTGYSAVGNMPVEATIYDYRNTSRVEKFHKATCSNEGGGNYFLSYITGNWHPAAATAITDIQIVSQVNMLAGTRAVLYGRGL